MFAAWYEKNGAAAEVMKTGELTDPEPAPGEVLIRLHASAVNPSDVKARAGSRPIRWPKLIPNSDGAGVVDAVGEGVTTHRIGDRVWTFNGQWDRPFGTSAQMIALPAALVVPLPETLNWEQGACLGIPVMTAHRCLFADGPVKGKTVLVTGGAGVVAHYAIQLAKWAGAATVLTTVSSEAKAAHARAAGADVDDGEVEPVDARRADKPAKGKLGPGEEVTELQLAPIEQHQDRKAGHEPDIADEPDIDRLDPAEGPDQQDVGAEAQRRHDHEDHATGVVGGSMVGRCRHDGPRAWDQIGRAHV